MNCKNIEDLEIGERVFVSTLHALPSEIYVINSIFLNTGFVVVSSTDNAIRGLRRIRFSGISITKLDLIDEDLNILNEI